MRTSLFAAFAIVGLLACSAPGSNASESPSPFGTQEPSPLAKRTGQLDSEVPMPTGFPNDVPIYTKARLTAGASFTSDGQVSWGMEWQTLDTVAKVRAFYADRLNKGDWTISFTNTAGGSFSATFTRRSNSQVQGTLASNTANGVTRILMSLVAPS